MPGQPRRKIDPPQSSPPRHSRWFSRRNLLCALVLIAAGTGSLFIWQLWQTGRQDQDPAAVVSLLRGKLKDARSHLTAGRWKEASSVAEEVLSISPGNPTARLIAGEAASRQEHYQQALDHYSKIGPSSAGEYLSAIMASAEIHRLAGSLDRADELYRSVLEIQPDNVLALDRLAVLFKLTGRRVEAQPVLLRLLERGGCGLQHLQFLADPFRPIQSPEFLERSLQSVPNQVFPTLGIVAIQLSRGQPLVAEPMLAKLRQAKREHSEIEAIYGRCLWELRDLTGLDRWHAQLAEANYEHPDVWHVLGMLLESRGQSATAGRCYLECLRRDPDHREATYRAGRILQSMGHSNQANLLLKRNQVLNDLAEMAGQITVTNPNPANTIRLVELLESLDRNWEAFAWAAIVARQHPDAEGLQNTIRRLEPKVRNASPFAYRDAIPGLAELAKGFPLPDRPLSTQPETQIPPARETEPVEISFIDESSLAGIEFQYFEDPDPTTEGRRMPEFTGGGVAAFDYDLDGWPDLYFTQGAELKPGPVSMTRLDQLFRNQGTGRFANVTDRTGLVEAGFSQGVAAGDYNNDGFPDLYVANLGENQLFENRGDGTFVNVSAESMPRSDQWTTSCAIADVNLDGIPDIYDVNYVHAPDLLERRCVTPAGYRVCSPIGFEAAPDRLCLGNGDGTFRDASEISGIARPGGKGLGLLIGKLTGQAPTDLFVANDTDANFLFSPQSSSPVFSESAIPAGVAFSFEGKGQACMGVAAADFDNNGQQDLFVTNYFNESNALYLARSFGFFEETSRASGLHLPSLPMLGFGTQAMDVDLDGWVDLVVANGDLDDFSHESRPLRMRPQLFQNTGGARFVERITESEGDYFSPSSDHRGRGLAQLDWNRDGLPDFVVCHLDEKSALVSNRTKTRSHFLKLRFVGTKSSRDAIGTTVRISSGGHNNLTHHAFLNAGNGYQVSNEKIICLGLGTPDQPVSVEVIWPDGTHKTHTDIDLDTEWLWIEGAPTPVKLPFHRILPDL